MRARRFLVAFELAAAVVLVVGAGLLVRSFSNLRRVDPGYDSRNLLLAHLSLTGPGYEFPKGWPVLEWPAYTAFADELRERLEAQPGVLGVAFAQQGPADPGWTTGVTVEGHPAPPPAREGVRPLRRARGAAGRGGERGFRGPALPGRRPHRPPHRRGPRAPRDRGPRGRRAVRGQRGGSRPGHRGLPSPAPVRPGATPGSS